MYNCQNVRKYPLGYYYFDISVSRHFSRAIAASALISQYYLLCIIQSVTDYIAFYLYIMAVITDMVYHLRSKIFNYIMYISLCLRNQ